jgi:predicted enzyme related to lactoylglutathione lyase
MPGPARAGALIYAKHLEPLSRFYRQLLSMALRTSDAEHHVLDNGDLQLIVHAIPEAIARSIEIAVPPQPREEQAIKLFFTVADLAQGARLAVELGGGLLGPVYEGPGFQARNAFDPEGNVFHLRAPVAAP